METDSAAIGARLQTARRAVGLTQGDVGQRMRMTTSTVSTIEAGKRNVTGPELYAFARLYQRPLEFFFEADDQEMAPGFQYLFRAANEKDVDRTAVVKVEQLEADYRLLEELTGAGAPPAPPDYSRFGMTREQDAETLAEMERSRLGLGDAPVKDLMGFLDEAVGVQAFMVPVDGQRWSGVAVRGRRGRSCVAVNSRDHFYRRNWSFAHEYAHVLVHLPRDNEPLARVDVKTEDVHVSADERFANAFAAAFLMPRRAVLAQLETVLGAAAGGFTDVDLVHMAMHFGVSGQALSARLVTLRKLPQAVHRDYWNRNRFVSVAEALGYDVEDTLHELPAVLPPRFRYLAMKAHEDGAISTSKLAELLRTDFYALQARLSAAAATSQPEPAR